MPDDVREYVKAAQAAELRGDVGQAIENLKKAAVIYRQTGKPARALQMLRHARRLDGGRQDILDELARYEWIPDQAMARAALEQSGEAEEEKALEALETGFIVPDKKLVERGPTLADPSIPAWCSFCCQPIKVVGPLVAGPAGAFVCAGCVAEAGRLLAAPDKAPRLKPVLGPPPEAGRTDPSELASWVARPTVKAPPPAFDERAATKEIVTVSDTSPVEFTGQAEALRVLDAAMRLNARLVLIIGPEGSGKTAYLKDLERRGLGFYVCDAAAASRAPGEQRLLIDAGGQRQGQLSEDDLPWVLELLGGSAARQVFIAVRGQPAEAAFALKSEDSELPMYSTRELVQATQGRLGVALASQVQITAPFRELNVAELTEVARRLAVGRAAELDLSDELLVALADEASKSGRGGRELESLIGRLPAGSWNLQALAKSKRPRKAKKRTDPKDG